MIKKTTTPQAAAAQVANPESGEMLNIKYFKGSPKQYRFNGQTGRFNIDGITDQGAKLTIQPLAWRIFKDDLFGRNKMDDWAEIFFVDATGCVSGIMFNNSSVIELMDLVPRLFYAEKNLSDVVLTITCEKKSTDKGGEKVTWYLAKFDFEEAPADAVAYLTKFAEENPIFRRDTITANPVYISVSDSYPMATAQAIAASLTEKPETTDRVAA